MSARTTTRILAVLTVALLSAAVPLAAQVTATLAVNDQRLQGTAPTGQLLLFSPDPVQLGSSISHWDPSATPNLLMEPSINSDLPFLGLDVTPALLRDEGWESGSSTFNVVSLDPPGEGFTDPRPFAGAPGNPAATLGEARINLFNSVLAAWADTLQSSAVVDVLVTWQPLFCEAGTGAVLAAAGTTFVFRNRPEFPLQDVWYHAALAEALAGEDLTGDPDDDGGDIIVFMNSDIDEGCLGPVFYYGLDGNHPPTEIDQSAVVLHEIGHGLGMANFTNETDGNFFMGSPGIFDVFTLDLTTGLTWAEMTVGERLRSAVNVRQVVWSGEQATAAGAGILVPGVPELTVASPPQAAGTYEIGLAGFGAPIPDGGLSSEIVCMQDDVDLGGGDTPLNGCSPASNPQALEGKIALIDRGTCAFTTKVTNAQAAGAAGAIIINNAGNTPLGLGGDPTLPLRIPAISVGRRDGFRLRQAACADAAAFLNDDGRFQVTATWRNFAGDSGTGRAVSLTADTGYFYFFDDANVELVVKVLDACELPAFNNFWVFAAGLTDVEVSLIVVDTQTGQSKTYFNPLSVPFAPIQDTGAFDTCP